MPDADCRECYARGGRLKDCAPCVLVAADESRDDFDGDGPALWPFVAALVLVVLAAVLIVAKAW